MFWLHVYLYITCVQCPQRSEASVISLQNEVREGCELLCRYWELNSGLLKSVL